jgi:tRNA-splicing ligase RtcB
MQIIDGIPVFGEPLENAVEQMRNVKEHGAFATALMADHHLGYSQPIGGVVAYKDQVSPSGVGYDIACGNKAVLTDIEGEWLRQRIDPIMDEIWKTFKFGIGTTNEERPEAECLDVHHGWDVPFVSKLKDLAASQLGTVGGGNHYIDLFTDNLDRVWIGVHFGSRGLGHKIATEYVKRAGGKQSMDAEPALLHENSEDGKEYLYAMHLAGEYAYAGRDWVCSRVAKILGAEILDEVHNHHNFAWLEKHWGEYIWVVRKGATPAWPGQRGFVGATMAESSVILEGVEAPESEHAMYSTVHGAGRAMSRMEAAGKAKWVRNPDWKEGGPGRKKIYKRIREGEISDEERLQDVRDAGVELRGSGNDEAMRAYKRLDEVLHAQGSTIRILQTLKPVGVAMAGSKIRNPQKGVSNG